MENPVVPDGQQSLSPQAAKNPSNKPSMSRSASFGAFGVGVVLTILGALAIVPLLLNPGIILILFALVLFGLSFVPLPEAVADDKPMPAFERLTKIFYAPVEVFQNLRRYPRWFAPLLLMIVAWSAYSLAFTEKLTPEKITDFNISKTTAQFGLELPPKAVADMRKSQMEQLTNPVAKIGNVAASFVGYFFVFALIAAVYFVIVLAMGGGINYWQALAAIVHAYFPAWMINSLLSLIILFFKDASDIHPIVDGGRGLVSDNLGILVNPADNVIVWALLSSFSLLAFYSLWLVATGLKNAGERVSTSAAWTAAIVVWLCGLVFGVVTASALSAFFT